MRLKVISSSSKGNGYLLTRGDGRSLAIEAGVKLLEIKKALSFNLRDLEGCIMSHWHGDHSGYVKDYLKEAINVYGPHKEGFSHHRYRPISAKEPLTLGGFRIIPLPVEHDVETFAFTISSQGKRLVFITDTYRFPYQVNSATHIMIEANFSHDIVRDKIDNEGIHPVLANRIYQSHMDIDTAVETVRNMKGKELQKIILLHLSDSNSNAEEFRSKMEKGTGVPTVIAENKMIIEL